jgi:RIO-like serine/threonine protein kinase
MYKLGILPDSFIQRVASNEKHLAIIYTPRGKNIQNHIDNMGFTRELFDQMFEGVRSLFNKGIIHRDLTPHHFLVTENPSGKTKKVFIIDFGSTILINKEKLDNSNLDSNLDLKSSDPAYQYNYQGSVKSAATEILKCLFKK